MAGAFCTSFRQSCQSTVTAPVSLLNPSFTDGVFGGNTSTVNGSLVSPTLPNTSCAMIVQLWPIMKGDGAFNDGIYDVTVIFGGDADGDGKIAQGEHISFNAP